MKKRINIFHTKHPSPFSFMSLNDLKEIHESERISAQDVATYYAHVACFETNSNLTDKGLCETIFHQINIQTGVFEKLASQDHIKAEKTHTTTSMGDIIQIDDEFYYCDDYGFENIKIEGVNNAA